MLPKPVIIGQHVIQFNNVTRVYYFFLSIFNYYYNIMWAIQWCQIGGVIHRWIITAQTSLRSVLIWLKSDARLSVAREGYKVSTTIGRVAASKDHRELYTIILLNCCVSENGNMSRPSRRIVFDILVFSYIRNIYTWDIQSFPSRLIYASFSLGKPIPMAIAIYLHNIILLRISDV